MIAVNVLSLVGALYFLPLLFSGQKELVNSWGENWIRVYRSLNEPHAELLLKEVRGGQVDRTMQFLQKKWHSIRKNDRLYPLKRELLFALAEELHNQGRYQELRQWAVQWQQLDTRDVDAIAFSYEALSRLAGYETEGWNGLREAWEQFPFNSTLVRFNYVALIEQGLADQAVAFFALIQEQMSARVKQALQRWEIRLYSTALLSSDSDYENYVDTREDLATTWRLISDFLNDADLGNYPVQHGMTPREQAKYWFRQGIQSKAEFGKLHATIEDQNRVVEIQFPPVVSTRDDWIGLGIDLDAKVSELRVDLPPGLNIQISSVRLRIGSTVKDVALDSIGLKNMERNNGTLKSASHFDPYFSFSLVDLLGHRKAEASVLLELDAQLTTGVGPMRLTEFLSSNRN